MIVMEFGEKSLATATSFRQVVSIVRSELGWHPVIVTSAMGETTDILLDILSAACKGNEDEAWKLQGILRSRHFAVCEKLLHGPRQSSTACYLRETFRDLHLRMLDLCEGEGTFDPELQDWTLSFGAQLSSRLLAAVLDEHCAAALHLDARKLILTDAAFTNAQPRYSETYARIRECVPAAARDKLVVLGGSLGGTDDGRTTTLGLGGSDLTASIVGAAISAEEIQIWKDLGRMSMCNPQVEQRAWRTSRKPQSFMCAANLVQPN